MYIDEATGMCAFKPLELEATGCAYNEDFPDLSQGPDESCTLTAGLLETSVVAPETYLVPWCLPCQGEEIWTLVSALLSDLSVFELYDSRCKYKPSLSYGLGNIIRPTPIVGLSIFNTIYWDFLL